MKDALIIFVRNPELGKVKTRLAAEIGDVGALRIYRKLLAITKSVALHTPADVFVFADGPLQDDFWNEFTIELQSGHDLGERMLCAFDAVFKKGYKKAVIIGSDCPALSSLLTKQAYSILEHHDIAIGPATDGGYYLLGMKQLHEGLFKNKHWSTPAVFDETIAAINSLSLSCKKLAMLSDVDVAADLPKHWSLLPFFI